VRRRVCLNFDRVIWCFVDVADIVLVVGRPRRHGDMMYDVGFVVLLFVDCAGGSAWAGWRVFYCSVVRGAVVTHEITHNLALARRTVTNSCWMARVVRFVAIAWSIIVSISNFDGS